MDKINEKTDGEKQPEYPVEELILLVAELAERYTGGDSSSITYEKAQQFMEAVKYCIRECHAWAESDAWVESDAWAESDAWTESDAWAEHDAWMMPDGEADASVRAVRRRREKPPGAREAYALGYQIVLKKTVRLKDLYHQLIRNFESCGNRCLGDTVMRGLPGFLQWYDARFSPQETLLTLDYPVLRDLSGLTGIDAVLEYGRCIAWEQAFLQSFDREWVRKSLRAYTDNPAGMIENLCGILLPDIIGHVVLKKPWKEMGYSQEEYRALAAGFAGLSAEETKRDLYRILSALTAGIFTHSTSEENAGIFTHSTSEENAATQYFCGAVPDLAARIRSGIRCGCLDQVFRI